MGSGTPWIDPESKGAILGLTLHTGRSDIIRAVLESVCLEQKLSLDIFETYGFKIENIRAVGGEANSPGWLKIRADILGKRIKTLKISDASCLGVGILSGFALDYYSSIEEAVHQMVQVKSEIAPDKKLHENYLEKYEIFKKIYPALKQINHKL